MNPLTATSKWTKYFTIGFFVLIASGVFINQYFVVKTAKTTAMYHQCDVDICRRLCSEEGGQFFRVVNMLTHEKDGWIDCKCVRSNLREVNFRYIPIPLTESGIDCQK